jgi:hypothetical protein
METKRAQIAVRVPTENDAIRPSENLQVPIQDLVQEACYLLITPLGPTVKDK